MAPAQEPNGDRTLGDPAAHRTACRNLGTSEQPSAARPNVLTQHGQEVLTLIGSGLSTAEAAERLFLSEGTVKAQSARSSPNSPSGTASKPSRSPTKPASSGPAATDRTHTQDLARSGQPRPADLLQSALIGEAQRCGAQTMVAFASATTDYAKLLRHTPWKNAGIDARLVTIAGVTSGAMSDVPRRLGQAFSAFWNRKHDSYPPGTTVELLR